MNASFTIDVKCAVFSNVELEAVLTTPNTTPWSSVGANSVVIDERMKSGNNIRRMSTHTP